MTEEIKLNKLPINSNPLYTSPEFLNKLEEYYDLYGSNKVVTDRLQEEFDCKIDRHEVAKIYKKNMAISVLSSDNKEFFDKSFSRMQRRWEDSWEMMGDLVLQYKKFRKIVMSSDKDELTQALTFLKMASKIIEIADAVRKQLEFIRKQQEEIKVYQQNNLIISPIQINQHIKSFFKGLSKKEIQEFFKSLDDNRYAKVVRELPEDELNSKEVKQ